MKEGPLAGVRGNSIFSIPTKSSILPLKGESGMGSKEISLGDEQRAELVAFAKNEVQKAHLIIREK